MKAYDFDHVVAESVDHAVELLGEHGDDAKVIAGGQSLVPLLTMRLASPALLIDIGRTESLRNLSVTADCVTIGGRVTHHDIASGELGAELRVAQPVFAEAGRHIGHLPIRTRGTFGGSLAHADSVSEWCLITRLFDATIVVRSTGGERRIPANEFFLGTYTTALEVDELLVAIEFDNIAEHCAFKELARRHGDFAIVDAAAALDVSADGVVQRARVVVGGVDAVPMRLDQVEARLTGELAELTALGPDSALADELRGLVADAIEPAADIHASAEFRRHLASELVIDVIALAVTAPKGAIR